MCGRIRHASVAISSQTAINIETLILNRHISAPELQSSRIPDFHLPTHLISHGYNLRNDFLDFGNFSYSLYSKLFYIYLKYTSHYINSILFDVIYPFFTGGDDLFVAGGPGTPRK